ncbi:hypothetical protein L486_04496 [Kwoniella mangroviensis CBS 10435]|uniref:Uncharacterized protein n=1 Tax=Kwoniella mangroviensis CBS 10435 TaxID=1331196 RepID=A0A1B9ISF1_9TREE|nr:hypothetical protein L486_04496 [Kwoniella mangroviensis CBS 10435]
MSDDPTFIPSEGYFRYPKDSDPGSKNQDTNGPLRYFSSAPEVNDTLIRSTSVSSNSGMYASSWNDTVPRVDYGYGYGRSDDHRSESRSGPDWVPPGCPAEPRYNFSVSKRWPHFFNRKHRALKAEKQNEKDVEHDRLRTEVQELRSSFESLVKDRYDMSTQLLSQSEEIYALKARLSKYEDPSTPEVPWSPDQSLTVPASFTYMPQ